MSHDHFKPKDSFNSSRRRILFVDCQTTGANPVQGHMIELAWARAHDPLIVSSLVALPDDVSMPKRITQLTGITPEDLQDAPAVADVITALMSATQTDTVMIAHFARFERPFLEHALGSVLPWPLICTHEITKRLLPNLPSKGLKALAGYFGYPILEVKRGTDHIGATRAVWQGLQPILEDHRIHCFEELIEWLSATKAPRRSARTYLIPKEVRLGLPASPGVYRFKNRAGQILYVGKATSLKQRVNSYFRGKSSPGTRQSEFLTQACTIDFTITATDVEAALLETDEIKHHDPPYNVALKQRTRQIVYFDKDFSACQPQLDDVFTLGPFAHATVFDWLWALRFGLDGGDLIALGLWDCDDPQMMNDALASFAEMIGWCPHHSNRKLVAWGLRWLRERLKEQATLTAQVGESSEDEQDESEEDELDTDIEWTSELLCSKFMSICRHAARIYLRAQSIQSLHNCQLAWSLNSAATKWRCLEFIDGQLQAATTSVDAPLAPQLRSCEMGVIPTVDIQTYDRLRTLRTEVNRLTSRGNRVQVTTSSPVLWLQT